MSVHNYFSDISSEIEHQSNRIRESFKSHKPTSGSNREAVISKFLQFHIPNRFGIGEGIVISKTDQVSNQADIVIYDQQYNQPLNYDLPSKLFLVESVYSLFEVKTELTPSQLKESVEKCKKFKSLERSFETSPVTPNIFDSLFVIFSFNAASPTTFKGTLLEQFEGIPLEHRPDLIVVPGSFVVSSGNYYKIAKIGQDNSPYRNELNLNNPNHHLSLIEDGFDIFDFDKHALFVFITWYLSWLQRAGHRSADLLQYFPSDYTWGKKI